VHPQVPGKRPADGRPRAERGRAVGAPSDQPQRLLDRLRRASASRPLLSLLLRGACLGVSLIAAVRFPPLIIVAAAVWLWVLWPAYAVRRGLVQTFGSTRAGGAGRLLPLWYAGGHPALPRPGRALLRVWQEDGAAMLRVGRRAVAFPLHSVHCVSLVEGRVERHTGCRGPLAILVGRVLAHGGGRFCGLRRAAREDLAVVDRSRVVCDLVRDGHSCRVILAGRAGGGEQIYLETLVLLRPSGSWRDAGPSGGSRGAAASPQNGG